MNKLTYYIKINTENYEDFDPNLESVVKDIIWKTISYSGSFDFEIIGLYDGYISSLKFNSCLNAFLHDMISGPDVYFTSTDEDKLDDYVKYVKLFITHFNDLNRDNRMFNAGNSLEIYNLDVFKEYEYEGARKTICVRIFIPVEEDESIKQKLQLGRGFMINVLSIEEMFKYLMAPLYSKLYGLDLLDNEELKKITTYQIGYH